jgi:hypothetical protein
VTLQATAVVPSGLGLSSSGSAIPVNARVDTGLFTTPLFDLWSSCSSDCPFNFSQASTLNWSVTLINPQISGNEVPPTFFGQIFDAGLLSCALAGANEACPVSLISFAGGTLGPTPGGAFVGGARESLPNICDGMFVICGEGPPFGFLQPAGSAPNSWSLSQGAMPVAVSLGQITGNASGTIILNVFSATRGDCGGGACDFSQYAEGLAGSFVLGPNPVSQPNCSAPNNSCTNFSVTFPSAGYWLVQAIYSGDANNSSSAVATAYNVTP